MLGAAAARRLGIDRIYPGERIWVGGQWFYLAGILRPAVLVSAIDSSVLTPTPKAGPPSSPPKPGPAASPHWFSSAPSPGSCPHYEPPSLTYPSPLGRMRPRCTASRLRVEVRLGNLSACVCI